MHEERRRRTSIFTALLRVAGERKLELPGFATLLSLAALGPLRPRASIGVPCRTALGRTNRLRLEPRELGGHLLLDRGLNRSSYVLDERVNASANLALQRSHIGRSPMRGSFWSSRLRDSLSLGETRGQP
jgi:hypothetical protein